MTFLKTIINQSELSTSVTEAVESLMEVYSETPEIQQKYTKEQWYSLIISVIEDYIKSKQEEY